MNAQQLADQYITVAQAAHAVHRDNGWVYRQLQTGKIEGLCIGGKWFVRRDGVRDADARSERRRAPATSAQSAAN